MAKRSSRTRRPAPTEEPPVDVEPKDALASGGDVEVASSLPPRAPDESPQLLEDIYAEEGGKADMTKLERRPRNRGRRITLIVIAMLAALLGVTVAGFFVFTKERGKFGQNITLKLDGPTAVASGDEVVYRVTYANGERLPLNDAELTLQYPDGFQFASASPKASNEFNNAWTLGVLESDGGGEVTVRGQIVGALGDDLTVRATLSYRPENFNYDFQSTASAKTTIASSSVTLKMNVPLRIIPKKEFTWTIAYTNESGGELEGVRIIAVPPTDFAVTSVDPAAKEQNRVWDFDRLAAGATGTITLKGTVGGEPGEGREFGAKVGSVNGDGTFRLEGETSSIVFLVRAGLTATVTVNGEATTNAAVWGDPLRVHLEYKNDGDSELTDATVSVSLVGHDRDGTVRDDLLDWTTLANAQKGRRTKETIVWDRQSVPGLASVKPGEGGTIDFTVDLNDSPTVRKDTDTNFSIGTTGRTTIPKVPELDAENFSFDTPTVTTKVTSKVTLAAEGRYYGEQYEVLGTGPLPPEVGKTTTYRIIWNVTNTTNDLSTVSVTAKLPENVLWTGRSTVSAGNALKFDTATRTVTWAISRVPAATGQTLPTLEASFEVSVTPQGTDVGTVLILLQKSALTGRDAFSEDAVAAEDGLITTELENDVNAKGKGIVQSAS